MGLRPTTKSFVLTAARELRGTGIDVLIVESGGREPGAAQALYAGSATMRDADGRTRDERWPAESAHEALVAALIQGRRRGEPLHERLGRAVLETTPDGRIGWSGGCSRGRREGWRRCLGLTVQRGTQAGAGIPR